MIITRAIAYCFITIVAALLLYLSLSLAALVLTPYAKIPTLTKTKDPYKLYLFHDLAHTEIILNGANLTPRMQHLLQMQIPNLQKGYIAFSYGDRDFMLHTPTWCDIDPKLTCRALFLDTPALIRIGHYHAIRNDNTILPLTIDRAALVKLQEAIADSMQCRDGKCIAFPAVQPPGIYYCLAKHPYNLFYTCNQWSADMLHAAGLPVPRWAPLAWEVVYPLQRAAKGG